MPTLFNLVFQCWWTCFHCVACYQCWLTLVFSLGQTNKFGSRRTAPTAACEVHSNIEPLAPRRKKAAMHLYEKGKREQKGRPNGSLVDVWQPETRLKQKCERCCFTHNHPHSDVGDEPSSAYTGVGRWEMLFQQHYPLHSVVGGWTLFSFCPVSTLFNVKTA